MRANVCGEAVRLRVEAFQSRDGRGVPEVTMALPDSVLKSTRSRSVSTHQRARRLSGLCCLQPESYQAL